MTAESLAGTSVIVTGAARGLGRAMALGLVAAGASVTAIYRAANAEEIAALLADAGEGARRILALRCDVTIPAQCEASIESVFQRFGALHGLVNNAALGMHEMGPAAITKRKKFYEIEIDLWRGAVDTNLNGAFIMARAAAPHFLAQSHGRIVNIGTSFRSMKRAGYSPYGPTKAALEASTAIWSQDFAGTGVTVNTLMPGRAADTRMILAHEAPDRATLLSPECMVAPIRWLMSRASDGVTGRRFNAEDWDASLPPDEAAKKAGVPAGW
jgi:NAD(P)-dependent dehydrogenase (short-subunit alcohol dehydrogenase family)